MWHMCLQSECDEREEERKCVKKHNVCVGSGCIKSEYKIWV